MFERAFSSIGNYCAYLVQNEVKDEKQNGSNASPEFVPDEWP